MAQNVGSSSGQEEKIQLSPFEVHAEKDNGYVATTTLGGTLIRTGLSDVGSAISVYTKEFLEDLGAVDNQSLLAFTVNADVGGAQGTFIGGTQNEIFGNGNSNTRIRGLAAADNTLNYFKSDAPWDGYNTDRIDVIRGANSILFGLGSPAGIINASSIRAIDKDKTKVQFQLSDYGSTRANLDLNRVIVKDVLSARVALLRDDTKYKQKPAFELAERAYLTAKYTPKFLQSDSSFFKVEVSGERGRSRSNDRRAAPPIDGTTSFFMPVAQGGLGAQTIDVRNPAENALTFVNFGTPSQVANPLLGRDWTTGAAVLVYTQSVQPTYIFEDLSNSANSYRYAATTGVAINAPAASGSSKTQFSSSDYSPVISQGYKAVALYNQIRFADRFGDRQVTDTSIFDFYNNLLDGDSKREKRDWTNGRIDITHSFFNNKLSYNLQYFKEAMDFDRYASLANSTTISIDASEILPDGSPNPNAGKAFLSSSPYEGSQYQTTDRAAYRATLFYEHDFQQGGKSDSWLRRFLGKHYFTATGSNQVVKKERGDYMSNGVGQEWLDTRFVQANPVVRDAFETGSRTASYFYVSDSLVGRQAGDNLGM